VRRQTQTSGRNKPEAGRSESAAAGQNATAKLRAERRKIAILILLVVTAVAIFLRQFSSSETPAGGPEAGTPSRPSLKGALSDQQGLGAVANAAGSGRPATSGKATPVAFKPLIKRRAIDPADPRDFDPTLRTDLLVRLADVPKKDAGRNVFDFYKEPVPLVQTAVTAPPPIVVAEVAPVVHPPPTPIPLRFFGHTFQAGGGEKRVFCLLNDQVMTPSEGAVLQRRYKIQKIMTASVVVEDLEDHHQQTLPIDIQGQAQAH